MGKSYKGSCFCGAVEISVSGDAAAAGYCHCSACRSFAAAPVRKFSLWNTGSVKIIKGEDNVGVFHKTAKIYRKFCKICGGHLMTSHPRRAHVDVYAATMPNHRQAPKLRGTCDETVLRKEDEAILR